MRVTYMTALSVPLLIAGGGALTEARAEAPWRVFGDVSVGGVHFSFGVHDAYRGGGHRHHRPGRYYLTSQRLRYPGYRCGSSCYRHRGHDYHHVGCPVLGVHFTRYGFGPPHLGYRPGFSYGQGPVYGPGYGYYYEDDRHRHRRGRGHRHHRHHRRHHHRHHHRY